MAGGSRASDDDCIAVENLRDPGWRGGGDDGVNGLEINGVHVEAEGVAAGIGEIDLGLFGVVGEIAHEGPGVHGVGLLKGGRGDSGLGSAVGVGQGAPGGGHIHHDVGGAIAGQALGHEDSIGAVTVGQRGGDLPGGGVSDAERATAPEHGTGSGIVERVRALAKAVRARWPTRIHSSADIGGDINILGRDRRGAKGEEGQHCEQPSGGGMGSGLGYNWSW